MKPEEMTLTGRIVHVTTKPSTVNKWTSVNSMVNTFLILMIFLTDSHQRADFASQFPVLIDWIARNGVVLIAAGTAVGGLVASFRRRAYDERSSDVT